MTDKIHSQRILILDFGSQYSQLIARRVRELGVYCELHSFDMAADQIKQFAPCGIILSGSPDTVTEDYTPRAPQIVFDLGCPVLGICYGMQTMAQQLGGKVSSSHQREFGATQLKIFSKADLFAGIDEKSLVWMSHGDCVVEVPANFDIIASSENESIAAIANKQRHFYGVQFHPEVTHSEQGQRILGNFIFAICHCEKLWTPHSIADNLIEQVQAQVGKDKVILGLSGGVDSSVLAVLLHKAIGDQLICIFIDNGLLRLNEAQDVMNMFTKQLGIKVHAVNAEQHFLEALQGLVDPEQKRKAIGKTFIDVFQEQARAFGDVQWLAQGTIYPDVIESAATKTGKAQVIKSHHNVGGLPETMHLKLVEPLRELFKDEVRKIGVDLGLAHDLIYRHPFPGPGLGVRIIGEVKKQYADLLRQVDYIFIEALRKQGLYQSVSQAFAVFMPIKSVGVMGDMRKHDYVVALRAVETIDFMTAQWARLPYDFLAEVSNRICNEVEGVARVVYDISSKPPATIEWE